MANTNQGIVDKVLTVLEKGVFTTGVIAGTLTAVCAYLWVTQRPIDETLKTSWLIIMGFFFNNAATYQALKYLTRGEK